MIRSRIFPLLLCAAFLTGCAALRELPPGEVLQRSALAGQKLDSATFTVDLDGTYRDPKSNALIGLTFGADGVFGRGGEGVSADVGVDMRWSDDDPSGTMTFRGSVAVLDDDETFIRVDRIDGDMADQLIPIEGFSSLIGSWVALPAVTGPKSVRLTPDPYVLKSQTSVVEVLEDYGVERFEGRRAYHYRVALDPDEMKKMITRLNRPDLASLRASGELWIDTETFYLMKAQWDVRSLPLLDGAADAVVTVTLADHDAAPPVDVPAAAVDAPPLTFDFPFGTRISWLLSALREGTSGGFPSGTF